MRKARKMRVRAFSRKHYRRGEFYEERCYQQLQERRWWGWRTVATEEVPISARIAAGATGDPGWTSSFAAIGRFGRDGVFTPHSKETAA
jgi:hypothetical protein